MRSDLERAISIAQTKMSQGYERDVIVAFLHDEGMTIVESIKTIKSLYNLGLAEAKEVVSANPVWKPIIDASRPMHDELIESLKRDGTLVEQPDGTFVDGQEL